MNIQFYTSNFAVSTSSAPRLGFVFFEQHKGFYPRKIEALTETLTSRRGENDDRRADCEDAGPGSMVSWDPWDGDVCGG